MYIDYYKGYLSAALDAAGNETSIFVDRITTVLGETVQTSDFAAFGRGEVTINPKGDGNTSFPEIASFTAVDAVNLAFTGVVRGLDKNSVSQTSLQRYYPVGTPVIISITSQTLADIKAYIDAAVTGAIGTASDTTAGTTKLTQNLGTLARAQAALVTQQTSANMTVQVKKFAIGDFVYLGGNSPSFVAPISHPRIDLLAYDKVLGAIVVKQGSEASSPLVPQMSGDYIALAYIYNIVGETSIKDVSDGTNGYVYIWCELDIPQEAGSGKFITGATIPTGYLTPDGSTYSAHTYPELARAHVGKFGYGTGFTATFNAATDVVTATSHGFVNGDPVFFANVGGALPGGVVANTLYYVISSTTNTFQISLTKGGSAVDITTAGTGTTTTYGNLLLPDLRGSNPLGVGTKVNISTFDATVGGVNVGTDTITVPSNNNLFTGQAVTLAAVGAGALPTGLTAGTVYIIRVDATHVQLATTLTNAQNVVPIDITVVGTGTATLTQTLTARGMGDTGGEEMHAMNINELLLHHHSNGTITGGTAFTSGNQAQIGNTGNTGGNVAMNIMNPYTAVQYVIRY